MDYINRENFPNVAIVSGIFGGPSPSVKVHIGSAYKTSPFAAHLQPAIDVPLVYDDKQELYFTHDKFVYYLHSLEPFTSDVSFE